jgi:hypothetical protein
MQLHGWKKYGLGAASMAVLVIAILLVGGWGTAAADQLLNVFVTNTAANPVPVSGTLTVTNPPASPLAVHETNTDVNGDIKVRQQGAVQVGGSVSVSNLPGTQPVSGTVNVGNFPANFPAAPTTAVIASGTTTFPSTVLLGQTDVSAYREVTLYLFVGFGTGQTCLVFTVDPNGNLYGVDSFQSADVTKTYDPAPPNIEVDCSNSAFSPVTYTWMLVGRTG